MYKEIKKIAISALLVALGVVFSRFLSIPLSLGGSYSLNIGFGLLPIIVLCVLYGPVYGTIGAIAWDLIGALLFPQGAFVIWFTLASGVFGFVTGMFFINNARPSIARIAVATACGQIIYSVLLNSFLISLLYNVPFMVLFVPRAIENAIMIVVNTLLVSILVFAIKKVNIMPERFCEKTETEQY